MKTILLLLLSINCFAQFQYRDNVYEYGITKQEWVITDNHTFCLFETDKLSDYVDLKVKLVHEKIFYLENRIYTNKGDYPITIHEINKYGYTVFRLYYRLFSTWAGIDSGITEIRLNTGNKWNTIKLNTNLNKLKHYGTVPNK